MPDPANHATCPAGLPAYEIRVTGRLDARWEAWFDGLEVTLDGGDTLLTGPVMDQAALHGLLHRVRDLGLPLVSVTRVESRAPRRDEDR
jgi:hypothetical protein